MREVTDRVPTATEPGDIKNSNNNNNNNPDCVTCAPSTGLDPTQNDQAGHQQTVKDGIRIGNSDDVKSRFDNDRGTDRFVRGFTLFLNSNEGLSANDPARRPQVEVPDWSDLWLRHLWVHTCGAHCMLELHNLQKKLKRRKVRSIVLITNLSDQSLLRSGKVWSEAKMWSTDA